MARFELLGAAFLLAYCLVQTVRERFLSNHGGLNRLCCNHRSIPEHDRL